GPSCAPSRTWSWPSGVKTFSRPCLIGGVTKACIGFSLKRYGRCSAHVGFGCNSTLAPAAPLSKPSQRSQRRPGHKGRNGLIPTRLSAEIMASALVARSVGWRRGAIALWKSPEQRQRPGLRRQQGSNNGGKNCAQRTGLDGHFTPYRPNSSAISDLTALAAVISSLPVASPFFSFTIPRP